MRESLLFLFLFICNAIVNAGNPDKCNSRKDSLSNLPLSEISRISKIATKYASGANIPEVVDKPGRRAKISVINNYKSAMLRRQMWLEILKTMSEPIIGYNVTISGYYSSYPPPVQAFMKSELPVEINSQCLNAFNYFYVYPNLVTCTPTPSKQLLEILFRYICMKSVNRIFNYKWVGSIFILRELIEKAMYSIKKSKVPQAVLNSLMSEYDLSPYKRLVPVGDQLGKHVSSDVEGMHIWQFVVSRSRLLYSIDSPTRAPRRGEWAFVLLSGAQTPAEFLYMRGIRFINTDSVQLITAILFTMILLKVKDPSKYKSYEVVIEDYNKMPKKSVNSNLLLAFSTRIATEYAYISNDWYDQIDTLLEIDLEEKENNREQTFIWNSKPLVSLIFEPDITLPDQLISNCVRYCEDLVSKGVVTVVGRNDEDDSSYLQKKLESICKKLQNKILPYKEIVVTSDQNLKSILKSSMKPGAEKKKLRFNQKVKVSVYDTKGMVGERTEATDILLGKSLKTSLMRTEENSTAKPEIPPLNTKENRLDLKELESIRTEADSGSSQEGLFEKTPYPIDGGD
ncbi:hypothetical protein HWI79_3046 [Cryptosporidium felis]|nr:hypothetical protein HWI79_3046 [Cryptosporidium felis]